MGYRKKYAFGFIAALALAGCGPMMNVKKAAEALAPVRTAEVQSGTFRIAVTATGKVKPNREVQVTSKAGGEILQLPFEAGQKAKKGELLVRLDPNDEQRNVNKREAELRASQARLEKTKNELELTKSNHSRMKTENGSSVDLMKSRLTEARAKFQRQEKLYKETISSEEVLETARVALNQAITDLTRAEATLKDTQNQVHQIAQREQDVALATVDMKNSSIVLDEAKERLSETEVLAPMDGVITDRKVEPGQVIQSAMQNVGGGTQLMVISDLSRLFVAASVDEADIGGVKVGQNAQIKADAFPGELFEGKVDWISPVGVEANSVVSFNVKVEVLGKGLEFLRPGMTADVSITINESPNTVWVQSNAVHEAPEGHFVEVAGTTAAEKTKVQVEIGITDGLNTEIKKGVTAGQKVVLTASQEKSTWAKD